jgi:hypothetical protein
MVTGLYSTWGYRMDRIGLEAHVMLELEALQRRVPQLSDSQLNALLTLLRTVVPVGGPSTLM